MSIEHQLPPPLTPADSNLRDFAFMPLDVARLRDSDLAAKTKGDEFRCAVLLWCAAWHQTPAGSLPDDDQTLAGFAGYGRVVREWKKVKAGAMRGWIKCSDGRFYHPVVAEKVNEAWAGRVEYQEKREGDRLRKQEERRLKKLRDDAAKSTGSPPDNCDVSEGQKANGAGNPPEKPLTVDSGQWTVDRYRDTARLLNRSRARLNPPAIRAFRNHSLLRSSARPCAPMASWPTPATPAWQFLPHRASAPKPWMPPASRPRPRSRTSASIPAT